MTTVCAAGSAALRRPLLGVVVPLLYLLALTGAVIAARDRADTDARPVELSRAATRTAQVAPPARTERSARVLTPRTHTRIERRRARRHAVVETIPAAAPVVSRSEIRPAPAVLADPAAFMLRIASVTTPATMQAAIDACQGPVEIDWRADPSRWGVHPSEIAEHDYCGGAAFKSLATGREVRVIGGGLSGLYVVNGLRRFVPSGAWASELDGMGDIALQTCVSNGMVLVGLNRIS